MTKKITSEDQLFSRTKKLMKRIWNSEKVDNLGLDDLYKLANIIYINEMIRKMERHLGANVVLKAADEDLNELQEYAKEEKEDDK